MRPINIAELYADHGIAIAPPNNSHARSGWVNTHCPFCEGSRNFHLGYNSSRGYFYCWRCGWKPVRLSLATLLNVSEIAAGVLARQYRATTVTREPESVPIVASDIPTYMPKGNRQISQQLGVFLRRRGFDPKRLIADWGLLGTDHRAERGWTWRILIPIYFDRLLVSYTSRAIGNDVQPKYRTCPRRLETIHHKHVLYGLDKVVGDTVAVVEGPMDVWRLGFGAVATFGTQVTPPQRVLLRRFKRIFIVFDGDSAGQVAGEKLAWQMSGFGLDVQQITLPPDEDPGSLSPDSVSTLRHLMGI